MGRLARTSSPLATALALGFFALALPAVSDAQRAPPVSEGNRNLARQLFQRGDTAYREGRYEAAIELFREAYRLSGRPLLLFNMANAQERMGLLREAVASLEQYLPSAGAETPDIRRRITALTERADQEQRDRQSQQAERERLARLTRENEERARRRPDPPRPVEARPFPARGLAIALSGVAVLGAGTAMGVLALGANGAASSMCATAGDRTLCQTGASSALSNASTYALVADISFGVGGVLTGVGVIVLGVDLARRNRTEESPVGASSAWWRPTTVGPGVGSLSATWRFR